MQTILTIPTKGDHCTLPGGIILRHRPETGEFIVHHYSDEPTTGRGYFGGGYHNTLSAALGDFTKRVERAEEYDLGGALDLAELVN